LSGGPIVVGFHLRVVVLDVSCWLTEDVGRREDDRALDPSRVEQSDQVFRDDGIGGVTGAVDEIKAASAGLSKC
jgi:hypothetical protein